MKKLIALLCVFFLFTGLVFADEAADEYDDGFTYESNGAGDQFIKIALFPIFPLNFGNQLHVGGGAELGYYKFLNKNFALGGEVSASFNATIGGNALTLVPFTFGVLYQPVIGKFEIPLNLSVGFAFETAQNASYFPGLALNAEAGLFYRISDIWSFGAEGKFLWLPQWFKDASLNKDGLFMSVLVCGRYHF